MRALRGFPFPDESLSFHRIVRSVVISRFFARAFHPYFLDTRTIERHGTRIFLGDNYYLKHDDNLAFHKLLKEGKSEFVRDDQLMEFSTSKRRNVEFVNGVRFFRSLEQRRNLGKSFERSVVGGGRRPRN